MKIFFNLRKSILLTLFSLFTLTSAFATGNTEYNIFSNNQQIFISVSCIEDSLKSNKVNHKAKIILDGDYLDFYIDDIFIHKFCRINKETLEQYDNLIKNGKCDLSKVTWP